MPSSNERKALWFLALVALFGSGVRLWRRNTIPLDSTGAGALAAQIRRVDSTRAGRGGRGGRAATMKSESGDRRPEGRAPSTDGREPKPVDLDRASEAEIETLPRIGPALARRIVAWRDSAGAFGSLDALCLVRGIGPALSQQLRPLVTFSAAPRPVSVACDDASKSSRQAPSRRRAQSR